MPFIVAIMAEYLTPLPGMLALTLETAINHVLQLDMESPSRVKKLEGRLLQVELKGLGISLFFTFKHGVVRVRLEADGTPDTVRTEKNHGFFFTALGSIGYDKT